MANLRYLKERKKGMSRRDLLSGSTKLAVLGGVRAVLECAGIKNILSKSLGTSNPHNQVGATINALERLEDPLEVAHRRGVPVRKVFEG